MRVFNTIFSFKHLKLSHSMKNTEALFDASKKLV